MSKPAWLWGPASLRRIASVKPILRDILRDAREAGCPELTIPKYGGLRDAATQEKIVRQGNSWTLKSKHLLGRAIDVAPYPTDWEDRAAFAEVAAYILGAAMRLEVRLEWGGLWTVRDMAHFELVDPATHF